MELVIKYSINNESCYVIYREAFSGYDPEIVSMYSEKKITSISTEYGIELSLVRGVVDNSKSIIQVP